MKFNALEKRIVELSFKHQLTHISSCLNCVNTIAGIYEKREQDEPFVLGAGHASLALYVVLEKYGLCDAEAMIAKHGTHASRDLEHGIWCSNGSLGQAETIAVGMALADRNRKVWLVTSDGACAEGAVWESIRFKRRHQLTNLDMTIIFNGYGAYGQIYQSELPDQTMTYFVQQARYQEFLRGLNGHYVKLNQVQYEELMAS